MKLYLIPSFGTDLTLSKTNPPLSEEGIRKARTMRLFIDCNMFTCCFTSSLAQDFGSAMLLVGDKVVIERDEALNLKKQSTATVEKELQNFLTYISKKYSEDTILVVANDVIITYLKRLYPEAKLLIKNKK